MRAIVKTAPAKGYELRREQPDPTLGPNDVIFKVAASSICGTDLHLYEWTKSAQAFSPKLPLVMGHECAGTIERVGDAVTGLAPGDRIAVETHIYCGRCFMCRTGNAHNCLEMQLFGLTQDGAFAQYASAPASACFVLPESVPLEIGALFEGSGVAVHALQRAGSVAGSTVLVCGCGPIGLVVIQLSLLFGATRVIAVEPNPYRRKLAERLGARVLDPRTDDVVAAARESSPRRGGVDVAFETSAAPNVLGTLFAAVRREGTIVTVGHPNDAVAVDIAANINKQGVILKGIFGRRIWDTWEMLVELVQSGRLDLSWLITHRLGLDDYEEAMHLLTGDAGKVILSPD